MASSYLDLINVTFEDRTAHQSTNTDDILGVVINHHWGPANQLQLMDAATFLEMYPNSLPIGAADVDPAPWYGYAQVLKALDLGINQVEVYRLVPSNTWTYFQVNISADGDVTTKTSNNQFDTDCAVSIASKYPGIVPQQLAYGYDKVGIKVRTLLEKVPGTSKTVTKLEVSVVGTAEGKSDNVIEKYVGTYNVNDVEDGCSTYLPNMAVRSNFISIQVNKSLGSTTVIEKNNDMPTFQTVQSVPTLPVESIKSIYDNDFKDIELSVATLVISPLPTDELNTTILDLARDKMNMNAVIGYPTTSSFDAQSIDTYYETLTGDKFTFFIAGRETITVFNKGVVSNCVGGWCGATANVARTVRLNQPASARTYGSYAGSLTDSLRFSDVLKLHEKGVISVYRSNTGPQIFGIRSTNPNQESYFGKVNVMRVTASILKNIFPIAVDAIHTDAAANAITRSYYGTRFQSIIDTFIAAQNLQADSFASCAAEYNTDTLTKGGKEFNVVLSLHFIGLVEKVNIRVIATDSSVTAEVVSAA